MVSPHVWRVSSVDGPDPFPCLACGQVYQVTSFFSIFAYVWLLFILVIWTRDVVTLTESILTFGLFWFVLGLAYCADKVRVHVLSHHCYTPCICGGFASSTVVPP